jgi:hypothetical protein
MFTVTMFNANLKLFGIVNFDITIDAAGKVVPQSSLASVRCKF